MTGGGPRRERRDRFGVQGSVGPCSHEQGYKDKMRGRAGHDLGGSLNVWVRGGDGSAGGFLAAPVDDVVLVDPAEFAENEAGRAEAGEDGLDEIQADEGAEQQPGGVDEVGEGDADEGDGAGEEADEGIGGHGLVGYKGVGGEAN